MQINPQQTIWSSTRIWREKNQPHSDLLLFEETVARTKQFDKYSHCYIDTWLASVQRYRVHAFPERVRQRELASGKTNGEDRFGIFFFIFFFYLNKTLALGITITNKTFEIKFNDCCATVTWYLLSQYHLLK